MSTQSLSISQARRVALAAQGFGGKRPAAAPGWAAMRRTIERMGALQIDSVNVCVRSHYMPLFARLGPYDCVKLDQKLLAPKRQERKFFEYWGHEASFLAVEMQPLFRWRMAAAATGDGVWGMIASFAREQPEAVARVRNLIRDNGAMATRELGEEGERGGGLWEWKRSKMALECLFWTGEITCAGRRNFERIYDLPERVFPGDILNARTPAREDAHRELIRIAAQALGVATAADLRDYHRLPAKGFDARVAELVEAGELESVEVKGWDKPAFLARGARLPRWLRGAALLTPFDPLVWFRPRAERLFDFHYRIEIYTPAEKRRFGYYCLPFLLDGALVARVDLKAERATGKLLVQSAHAEAGCCNGDVAVALAGELARLAAWQGLESVVVRGGGELDKLLRAEVVVA